MGSDGWIEKLAFSFGRVLAFSFGEEWRGGYGVFAVNWWEPVDWWESVGGGLLEVV